MKRVLLTGGTGFIGRQAVPALLARGYEVRLLIPPAEVEPAFLHAGVRLHRGDFLAPAGARDCLRAIRPTHLLHFAWYVEHGAFWTSPENRRWVSASLRLLEDFARFGGRRAVMAGTCGEYAWPAVACRENQTPLQPDTLYGKCKHRLREESEKFAESAGLSLAWGRIFFLYGPGEDPRRFVPSILLPLLAGRPAVCRSARHVRDLLYVEDVADAFAALLDGDVRGPVNVAFGRGVVLGEAAAEIARIVARPDLLTLEAQAPTPDNPDYVTADTTRLNREVGWQPRYDLSEGLERTVDWWKKRLGRGECETT